MIRVFTACCFAACCWASTVAADETYFAFDSASNSWVGRGYTNYFVSPDVGWSISASRNFDNGVSFRIDRDAGPDPGRDNYYWSLDFAAPFNALLTPGVYTDSARFPFQDFDQPGLTLSGNHRGNNQNGGFFEVLQAQYGAGGEVLRFSADFTQYDERQMDRWIVGQIRFNALVVPEPMSSTFLGSSLLFAWVIRKWR